ncbi:MAG: hypothetical protein U9Q80_03075 [Bacillota bacterium]|nr:hypothetical protein [Bacillota bacterium]
MSKYYKYSITNFILWLIVAISFLSIFLNKETINNWGDNRTKTIAIAFLYLFGFSGQLIFHFLNKKKEGKVDKDERDLYIQNRSMYYSFTATLMYVFIVTISIYSYYEKARFIPIAWMWFVAYSLIFMANIITSFISIILYKKSGS